MALWRRWLFVIYAVTSWIYRWIITFVILWFLYNWLRPYKLGVLSGMLALAALASMIGWPIYRLGKNIHRRGRLPDMKPVRVTMTCTAFVALILAVFLIPVPISRVHAEGVVELEPESWESVYVSIAANDQAVLKVLKVKDGQRVREGEPLAVFSNRQLEAELAAAELKAAALDAKIEQLRKEKSRARDDEERDPFEAEILAARNARDVALQDAHFYSGELRRGAVVAAPRDGIVMVPPSIDDVGKLWDKKVPLCKVGTEKGDGEADRLLRVVVPIEPPDYNLLQADMAANDGKPLLVRLRVNGMGKKTWRGVVRRLPESEAATVPPLLSNRTGGPVAVKPGASEDQLVPQAQQYLVSVELLEPSADLPPGVRAKVKIYCQKRTVAWWIWHKINDLFNLGLM